jgi:hypothetical protein
MVTEKNQLFQHDFVMNFIMMVANFLDFQLTADIETIGAKTFEKCFKLKMFVCIGGLFDFRSLKTKDKKLN